MTVDVVLIKVVSVSGSLNVLYSANFNCLANPALSSSGTLAVETSHATQDPIILFV